jgi:hypothetical protein
VGRITRMTCLSEISYAAGERFRIMLNGVLPYQRCSTFGFYYQTVTSMDDLLRCQFPKQILAFFKLVTEYLILSHEMLTFPIFILESHTFIVNSA